jgi:hypothetical protein
MWMILNRWPHLSPIPIFQTNPTPQQHMQSPKHYAAQIWTCDFPYELPLLTLHKATVFLKYLRNSLLFKVSFWAPFRDSWPIWRLKTWLKTFCCVNQCQQIWTRFFPPLLCTKTIFLKFRSCSISSFVSWSCSKKNLHVKTEAAFSCSVLQCFDLNVEWNLMLNGVPPHTLLAAYWLCIWMSNNFSLSWCNCNESSLLQASKWNPSYVRCHVDVGCCLSVEACVLCFLVSFERSHGWAMWSRCLKRY